MLTFDELNILASQETDSVTDLVTGLITGAYYERYSEVCAALDEADEVDYVVFEDTLFKEIQGKTYLDRLEEHIKNDDTAGIARVLDTEYHRMRNAGGYNAAKKAQTKSKKTVYKQWITMDDDRVRATHEYIDEVSVPIDERFFTFDGDSALYPGDFTKAENNVNCRCWLDYKTVREHYKTQETGQVLKTEGEK